MRLPRSNVTLDFKSGLSLNLEISVETINPDAQKRGLLKPRVTLRFTRATIDRRISKLTKLTYR